MAQAIVGGTGNVTSTAVGTRTNTTINKPTGTLDGHKVWVVLIVLAGVTVTAASGFTEGTGSPFTYDSAAVDVHWYWHDASSDGASYTFNHASTTSAAHAFSISGSTASGDPNDATPVTNKNDAGSTSAQGSAITAVASTDLLILFVLGDLTGGASSTPGGMTEQLDLAGDAVMAIYTEQLSASGSTGTRTSTITSQKWGTVMILSKEAAAASGPTYPQLERAPYRGGHRGMMLGAA